jgi:D-3-phosphoglycerate dehydrogenase
VSDLVERTHVTSEPTIVLTDRGWADADIETDLCRQAGYRLVDVQAGPNDQGIGEQRLVDAVRAADPVGLLFNWAPVTDAVLGAGPRLQVATRLGVGVDNIDLASAARRHITVTRVPDYCVEEVSDHVIAVVHAWARGLLGYDHDIRQGRWAPGSRSLRRVRDLTVGVWGRGAIGSRVAAKFAALDCRVLTHDRKGGHPLEELLSSSDVITLHVPATPDTRNLVDAAVLARVRPGALLVNTSRGSVVDLDALVDALQEGRLGGAALDVLPDEPHVPARLVEQSGVILTPHVAFSSTASVLELRTRATRDLLRVLAGEQPQHPVPAP